MSYRIEYAASGRSACKGALPCKGNKIEKGSLRWGVVVEIQGNTSFAWRHFGCLTSRVIANVKSVFENASEVDGYDELEEVDKLRWERAFENGQVDDEDIPLTARKPVDEDGNVIKTPRKRKNPVGGEVDSSPSKAELNSDEIKPEFENGSTSNTPIQPKATTKRAKKEKVKPELDEDGNPIKKAPKPRIAPKKVGEPTSEGVPKGKGKAKAKPKPKAKAKGKGRKKQVSSEEEEEASAQETEEENIPSDLSDEDGPAPSKRSKKSNSNIDAEFDIPLERRQPSRRVRTAPQKSFREVDSSDEEPDRRMEMVEEPIASSSGIKTEVKDEIKDEE